MISKAIGFFLCLFAVLLPWRLRILFAEFLGWLTQLIYYTYYGIFNYILRELRKADSESKRARE
jgi:hypothetical protein